jgi:ATP-dependent Clp protease, protease subunit
LADYIDIAIPKDIENLQLPDPALLQYYVNAQERNYWVDYDIDESLLCLSRDILNYNRLDKNVPIEDRKPIILWIFSYGGSLDAVYNAISVCALSKTPIITINAGVAMSAGLLLLLAGHKRYTFEMADALIHSGSGGAVGTFEQAEASMENYKKAVAKMRKYILDRTGMDPKVLNKNKSKDWYLDSSEQIQHNIVQKVLTDLDEIL